MSSLSHARLASIAQRYLSISSRGHDIFDKSKTSCTLQTSLATQNLGSPVLSKMHGLNRIPEAHRYVLSVMIDDSFKETNTPNTTLESSISGFKDTCRSYSRNYVYSLTHHKLKGGPGLDWSIRLPNGRKSFESVIEYSQKITKKLNCVFALINTLTSFKLVTIVRDELTSHHWNYKSRDRNKNENTGHKNSKSFFKPMVLLGVLGMFRLPSASELEEERAILTDEQKMKKMKPIELKIARGVLLMCDQDYDRANQLFHEALHMAQDENDEERENLLLNLIASNYFEKGDYQKAEKLFIDLIKRMLAHEVATTSPSVLELSLKLASIYSKNPETQDKALKGFKFVINSLLHNLNDIINDIEELDVKTMSDEKKDELALLGWSYDWFAKHLLQVNDFNSAADMLQRAFRISSLVLGPLHDQTLILLNDVGTTLAMNGSPEEGQTFIKKAVEGAITSQSKELASFYVNLGLVNLKLRKFHEAKRYCEYSIELAKKNRDHYNTQEIIELSRSCLNDVQRFLDVEGQRC